MEFALISLLLLVLIGGVERIMLGSNVQEEKNMQYWKTFLHLTPTFSPQHLIGFVANFKCFVFTYINKLNLDLSPEALAQEKEGRKGIFFCCFNHILSFCNVFIVSFSCSQYLIKKLSY